MTRQSSNESELDKQIVESEFNSTQQSKGEQVQSILIPCSEPESGKEDASQSNSDRAEATLQVRELSVIPLSPVKVEGQSQQGALEDSGRERLKRHRVEVAGRVWIPDMWGQEELLKDWIDCSAFDASLMNSKIMLARAALVQQGRRANSRRLRIENRC